MISITINTAILRTIKQPNTLYMRHFFLDMFKLNLRSSNTLNISFKL